MASPAAVASFPARSWPDMLYTGTGCDMPSTNFVVRHHPQAEIAETTANTPAATLQRAELFTTGATRALSNRRQASFQSLYSALEKSQIDALPAVREQAMMPGGCFHSRVEGRCSRCQRRVDSLHMPLEVAGSVFCGSCCPLCKPKSKRKRDWHGRYASEGVPPAHLSKN